jgi:hypothetical protein
MNQSEKHISEDRVSVKELIERIQSFIHYLWLHAFSIAVLALGIALIYFSYHQFRKTVYSAQTTFVLETGGGSSGNISSLASVVGIDLNSLSGGSTLFEEDNIIELYRSRRMLYETLLSKGYFSGDSLRLISRWVREENLIEKWRGELGNPIFNFEIPQEQFTVKHDSLLFKVIKDFQEKHLVVDKPDRLLSILSVTFSATDQQFAKIFNEALVEKVNNFYLLAKTKKTGENLKTLLRQADSTRMVLDDAIVQMARATEQLPNPNPLYASSQVPIQKLSIDVQANAAVYEEIVKNLEVAKISHRNNTPLILIIDGPMYPLTSDKDRLLKRIIIGLILGGFLSVFYFSLVNFWQYIKKNY